MQERCQAAKESHGAQLRALPKYQRYGAVAAALGVGSGGGYGWRGGRWRPNTRVTLRTPLYQPCVP